MTSVEEFVRDTTVSAVRAKLGALLPQPKTRSSSFTAVAPRSIVVFRQGPNPSFSYFLEERLRYYGAHIPVSVRCLDDDITDIEPTGCFIIICRYIGARLLKWIERHVAQLAGVGIFIDDDVSGIMLDIDAPLSYRAKLARFHLWPLRRLNPHLDIVWAPTPTLVELLKTNGTVVRLLAPLPSASDSLPLGLSPRAGRLVIGYHATGIHYAEHVFLKPIVSEILLRHPNVVFEVSANGRNARVWRDKRFDQSRLRILPTLPWEEFSQRSRDCPVDIALVPLLDKRINMVRADTKRIDVCRMGAAAIFSKSDAYALNQHPDEILIENDHDAWIAAIELLMVSEERRKIARLATFNAAEQMRSLDPTIPGLLLRDVSK